jgi:hypothetical protein
MNDADLDRLADALARLLADWWRRRTANGTVDADRRPPELTTTSGRYEEAADA